MRNSSRTDTRLVGKRCTFEALDQGTDNATSNTGTGKGPNKDLGKSITNHGDIGQDNNKARRDIDDGHQWHDLFGDLGDGLDAADNHHTNDDCHDQAKQPARPGQEAVFAAGDIDHLLEGLIGLKHVPAAHGTTDAADRKDDGQYLAKAGFAFFSQPL